MSESNPILLKARSELALLPHNLAQPRFMWVETQPDPAGHFQLMWVKTAFTLQLSFPSPCTQMYKNSQMPLSPRFPWDKAPYTTCHLLFLQHPSVVAGLLMAVCCFWRALWAGWDFHVLSVLFSCLPILCSRYCLEASTVIWVKSSITYFYGFLHTPRWNGGQTEVPPLPKDLSHFSSWCLTWLPDSCHRTDNCTWGIQFRGIHHTHFMHPSSSQAQNLANPQLSGVKDHRKGQVTASVSGS